MIESSNKPESDSQARRIHLPKRYTRPVKVRITSKGSDDKQVDEFQLTAPFRVGHSNACEVQLPTGKGPDVLFEFAPMNNTDEISLPLDKVIGSDAYEIYLNDEIVTDTSISVKPGSSVRLYDKNDQQEIELSVYPNANWKDHIVSLYLLGFGLLIAVLVIGYVVSQQYAKTDARLDDTVSRLSDTETLLSNHNAEINRIIDKFSNQKVELEHSLTEIRNLHEKQINLLGDSFSDELRAINESSRRALLTIAENDQTARERLMRETQEQINSLKAEMSERLISTSNAIKQAQTELYHSNTKRIESLERENTVFKDILIESQKAVIFIKTSYQIKSKQVGTVRATEFFGTGFTISSTGLSIAPQHVLKPWLYDDNMLAMQALDLIEVVEGSVKYVVWTSSQQVLTKDSDGESLYATDDAFATQKVNKGIALLYTPEPELAPHVVASPFGAVAVERPVVGHTDIAVFHLNDFSKPFNYLDIVDSDIDVEPMDEVLLVGYPLSRLHDGKSIPQGVSGFVRRQTTNLLELDSALHPGSSGAPILNRESKVIGMAVALINSATYGIAVPASHLQNAVEKAKDKIIQLKHQLLDLGCYSGELDENFDQELWNAKHDPSCQIE